MLTRLVNDLRDLSLADSGQLKLELAETNIVELLQRKLSQFEVSAGQKNISLKCDVPAPVRYIRLDARRIEQVISNLISNAIRHTPQGGQITIALKEEGSPSRDRLQQILISVADTGEGISAEHIPHLFERFYRVETSRSRREGGAGLGLAIVKQMVEAHGGKVSVESQPGRGSTFNDYLPYR